jgi:hypothetical protein
LFQKRLQCGGFFSNSVRRFTSQWGCPTIPGCSARVAPIIGLLIVL